MLRGWLREDEQAVIDIDLICQDGSRRPVPAVIDTGFNGQLSLSRHIIDEIDFPLAQIGTIEMELANGDLIEEDVYSGMIRFDGNELMVEILLTDAGDTFIGTGLLTGKVLIVNFATREVTVQDHRS